MIAFVDDLPLLEFPEGSVFAFQEDWLRSHLIAAATLAGYENWWLADHVTQSVTFYLSSQFAAPVVDVGRLVETVQSVLQAIGYSEIGEHFRVLRPVRENSLLQLARSSNSCELLFFEELRLRIQTELSGGAATLSLAELAACCKFIKGAKHFTRDCAALREEIVSYTIEYVQSLATGKTVSILIR